MKRFKKEITDIFEADLSALQHKLFKLQIGQMIELFVKSNQLQDQPSEFIKEIWMSNQLIDFIILQLNDKLRLIQEIQELQYNFNYRYSSAITENEKKTQILQLAKDLGATPAQIKGDQKAFKRWFDYDAVLERCTRRIAQAEYDIVFILNRLGVIASNALKKTLYETEQESILNHIKIDKTLKPLLAFKGDERVRVETFLCLAKIIKYIPIHIKEKNIEQGIITFIYRASMDITQSIWIQNAALELLSLLDQRSFFLSITKRLFNAAKGDDLFVRRKAITLLLDHISNEKEIKKFLPTISRDPSPFVRQAVPSILVQFLIKQQKEQETQDIIAWLRHLMLKDPSPQVRASTILSLFSSINFIMSFINTVSDLFFDHFCMEKDPFVLRVGFKTICDITKLINDNNNDNNNDDKGNQLLDRHIPCITNLHQKSNNLSVRRWAALTREKLIIQNDKQAKELMLKLQSIIPLIKPGKSKRIPKIWLNNIDDIKIGRVLSVLTQEDFSLSVKKNIFGISLFKGDCFGFSLWRFLYEILSPSPDKRQGFSHVIGRKYFGYLRAPSAICSELSQTKVPGEPLFFDTESGWRPYMPMVDEMLCCSKKIFTRKPVQIFTPEGITKISSPNSLFKSLFAYITLTIQFTKYAKLRNWYESSQSKPNSYVKSLRKLGFNINFQGFKDIKKQKDEDPCVTRFFSFGLPLLSTDLWIWFKDYFFSAYENSLYELGIFAVFILFLFVFRKLYYSYTVLKARNKITLVIGGWGTRGKSGVERLKASIFESLGHGLVNKTTGCEAMFLHAFPFGKTKEMFLFRPYDKATIWEHHNILQMAQKLKSKIFLWECMALTPNFVTILQQQWTRDDFSTITNTYPDHEDIQGPAGINIPQVMTNFIPQKGTLITSEEEMKPILTQAAKDKKTKIEYTSWLESGLLTPDVLSRFPYEEHPNNVALVLKLAKLLDINTDFAIREMADRVVPDIGALKIFPIASINQKRLEFINGMSANERFAAISNWKRMGFESHDYEKDPGTIISSLVNNRADRIPRSKVFASIIVEDLSADFYFLIGSNLTGLLGFIHNAWDNYIDKLTLFSDQNSDEKSALNTFISMAIRMRIPTSLDMIYKRYLCMLKGLGINSIGKKVEENDLFINQAEFIEKLKQGFLNTKSKQVKQSLEKWYNELKEFEEFQDKIKTYNSEKELDSEFKDLITTWFKRKIVVIDNIHVTGNQIINTICNYTPPGLLNRIMGLQNIKGPGLDYVYTWQAWEKCYISCQKLLNYEDPLIFEQGFNELISFQDYGILCEDYVNDTLNAIIDKTVAQTERYQAGFSLIRSNMEQKINEIKATLNNVVKKSNILNRIAGFIESVLDAGDAVKRRKIADKIYKDLINERISHERAANELKKLNKRQKGGWFMT